MLQQNTTFERKYKVKYLFFLSILGLPTFGWAAVISGQFRNATPGMKVELFVPHRYLDGRDGHYRTVLNEQSQFALDVEMPEPQLAFLLVNDDQLPVFLSPQDTLSFRADAFQFPMAVHFTGKAGGNNRFLQEYLRLSPLDFNEFNNIRFKIGQYWTAVEAPINSRMEDLSPNEFKAYMDTIRLAAVALFEQNERQAPGTLSKDFVRWLHSEVTYFWAYNLLVYGHVYAGRHGVQHDFFDFLYEAPIVGECIGSESYRQFLQAFMARQQSKVGDSEDFWAGQYHLAGRLLSEEPLAYLRSEIIYTAFSAQRYRELLPLYTHFLQTNDYIAFDTKVGDIYQKYARVLPGTQAPPFATSDIYGEHTNLNQFRGKVVYLNFWASWCGACVKKMEIMDGFAAEFEQKGIEVVNVSIDEEDIKWVKSLAAYGFSGRHIRSIPGVNIAALYGVEAVPQYFIIGRDGSFADKASASQPADIRHQLLLAAGK